MFDTLRKISYLKKKEVVQDVWVKCDLMGVLHVYERVTDTECRYIQDVKSYDVLIGTGNSIAAAEDIIRHAYGKLVKL